MEKLIVHTSLCKPDAGEYSKANKKNKRKSRAITSLY